MNPQQKLYQQYRQGMAYIESDPDECIRLLSIVSQEAEKLGSAYYRVLADHWRLQALIIYKRDFVAANHLAIEAAIDVRKPEYLNFQEYVCIQQDLILVYQGIDPIGYASLIKEAIDLMIKSTTPELECRHCLMQTLVQYHLDLEEVQRAKDYAAQYFSSSEFSPYHRGFASSQSCHILYHEKNYAEMLSYARIGAKVSERANWVHYWVELKAWEMLALQHTGEELEAKRIYWLVIEKMAGLKMVPHHRYFIALRAYHEACNDNAAALEIWERYLGHLSGSGQYHWECLALLDKIRLMKLLALDSTATVSKLKQVAQGLKNPEWMISRLEA